MANEEIIKSVKQMATTIQNMKNLFLDGKLSKEMFSLAIDLRVERISKILDNMEEITDD
jgi:hypothetical protein